MWNASYQELLKSERMYFKSIFLCILLDYAVKESCRRQGHGEALLRAAIEKCRSRKIQRVSLHVDPTRIAAVNLYKKHGFQVDCLVKSYYSADRDAYRMYLDFDESI